METPAPLRVIYRYRYMEAGGKHWKYTRHHMSPEEAVRFFAPGLAWRKAVEKWEPLQSSRMEIPSEPRDLGPGVGAGRRKEPPRLTIDEVKAIWERNRNPDTRRLVWEIWYLRETVERARDICAILEIIGIDPVFRYRLWQLKESLQKESLPEPRPVRWFPDEEEFLERIARSKL